MDAAQSNAREDWKLPGIISEFIEATEARERTFVNLPPCGAHGMGTHIC